MDSSCWRMEKVQGSSQWNREEEKNRARMSVRRMADSHLEVGPGMNSPSWMSSSDDCPSLSLQWVSLVLGHGSSVLLGALRPRHFLESLLMKHYSVCKLTMKVQCGLRWPSLPWLWTWTCPSRLTFPMWPARCMYSLPFVPTATKTLTDLLTIHPLSYLSESIKLYLGCFSGSFLTFLGKSLKKFDSLF